MMSVNTFFMCIFIAALFYGLVTLRPSPSASRKKQKRKRSQVVESTAGIVMGAGGLLLMMFALIFQNPTAQAIYALLSRYWLIAAIFIMVIDFIVKITGKAKKAEKAEKSVHVGDIEVIYGMTTPQVFVKSAYRVAYETMVQEPEIPFITCELQTAQDNRYIGDLIFEAKESVISEKELSSLPISEIHLDRKSDFSS